MAKPKGSDKIAGREKGTPNKLTQTARQLFVSTLENQVDNIDQAFSDVLLGTKDENGKVLTKPDPAKYLELYSKYAQYFVPKKLDLTTDNKALNIPITSWADDSKKPDL